MKKYKVMKDTPFHKEWEIISEDDKDVMYDREYIEANKGALNHFDSFSKKINQFTKEELPTTFIFNGVIYEQVSDTYCYTNNLTTWMSEKFPHVAPFISIPQLLEMINSSELPVCEVREIRNHI